MSKEMNGSILLTDVLPTMEASGKYTQEQLDAFAQLFAEHKYNPEEANAKIHKPKRLFFSTETTTIGDIDIKIRKWSGRDTARILPKLEFFYLSIPESDKTKTEPSDFDPMEFAGKVINQALKERSEGKLTELVKAVYDELMLWIDPLGVLEACQNPVFVNEETGQLEETDHKDRIYAPLDTEYLLDCPLGDIKIFIEKFIEVNQKDFLHLFGTQHKNLGSLINFLIGKVFSLIETVILRMRELNKKDSDGGT